jgi:hypothetical protein
MERLGLSGTNKTGVSPLYNKKGSQESSFSASTFIGRQLSQGDRIVDAQR